MPTVKSRPRSQKQPSQKQPSQKQLSEPPAHSFLRRRRAALLLGGIVAALAFYLASIFTTRSAFFIDEASIAYNAYKIAHTGADEYGARWPLYFRAFGEYKNPIYIYLLAALYKVFGPGELLARMLSAALGFVAAALLGLLSARVTKQRLTGIIIMVIALLTPWLFEVSRLVFEVALFPLLLTLFLLALQRVHVHTSARWPWRDILWLSLTLALLTYSYSIGRLFAPLLAAGLLLFANRERLISVLQTWLCYAALLTPLFIFQWRHPEALGGRFSQLTYITPTSGWFEIGVEFVKHYLSNLNPLSLLLYGDPNLLHHIPGMGSLLAAPFLLAVCGVALVIRRQFQDPWRRFALYGLIVSPLPASLTNDELHTLRLIPLPIFMLLFTAHALAWLLESGQSLLRRQAAVALLFITALQAAFFQWQYYEKGQRRIIDYGYKQVFEAALGAPNRPLCVVAEGPANFGYIQAYWNAAVRGIDTSQIVRLSDVDLAPSNSVVIGEISSYRCARCQVIKKLGLYLAYTAP
jgi:4-amino-4-deoxy-L-arabinose transferase-like glycosyltransferase